MKKQKIIRLALAGFIFVAVIAAFVAVWSSQLLQAAVFGVVIVAMLAVVVVMTFEEGQRQSDNYH
jgi:NhaP-type Na+/H+ or K+/H+ antiporter